MNARLDSFSYDDDIVRKFLWATMIWGLVGFLVGQVMKASRGQANAALVQAALRERGADALEAPVTGSKNGAENATLLFMTGGDRAVHDELLPVMMAMGTKAIHCGEMGQGSTVKLIGNSVISFMLEALCEGMPYESRLERVYGCVDAELAEQQADGDPAERAGHADGAELCRGILEMAHRQRVGQRERRREHVLAEARVRVLGVEGIDQQDVAPLYRRREPNLRLMEYKCVEFVEELMYGQFRKQPLPR